VTSRTGKAGSSKKSEARAVIAICFGLLTLLGVVYSGVAHYGFVNYDDPTYVTNSPVVANGVSWHGVVQAFSRPHARNWHPVTTLSHMLDVQLFGMNPGPAHLTNVALHGLASLLLFLALRSMTSAMWRSAYVAAVFAVHPLRVESVAWISERKDVLSAVFFSLTLFCYVRYTRQPGVKRYAFVLGVFILGLLSKPMLVTLPIVLLFIDWWPLQRFGTVQTRQIVAEKLPLVGLAMIVGFVTYLIQKGGGDAGPILPFSWRLSNGVVACLTYLAQLVWPVNFAPFYPHPNGHIPISLVAGSISVIAIALAAFGTRKKQPYLLVGWSWYLVMLMPVIGIIQVGLQSHADRYTYLPQIGIVLSITWLLAHFAKTRRSKSALAITGALSLILLTGCARRQTSYWQDSETLWLRALAVTAGSDVAHNNLGMALLRQGRVDEAIRHFHQALDAHGREEAPYYTLSAALAHSNLAVAFSAKGDRDRALAEAEETVRLQPGYADGHFNLATILVQQGVIERSIHEYTLAVELSPEDPEVHTDLANALLRVGRERDAIAEYRRALEIAPRSVNTLNNLAWVLATSTSADVRNGADARRVADAAVKESGGHDAFMLRTAAAARAETGAFPEAIATAQLAASTAEATGEQSLANEIRRDIVLYESGTPLREAR